MKIIELFAQSAILDKKTLSVTYTTGVTANKGFIFLNDETGTYDMFLNNQVHSGGEVILKMRPIKVPSKKYEVGDKIGALLLID